MVVLSEPWWDSHKRILMLVVVLLASLSLPYFRYLNTNFPNVHPAVLACIAGGFVTMLIYLPMRWTDEKFAFSHAVLAGLLVAEFCVYGAPLDVRPVAIAFFFFMFFYGVEEANHLWPSNYEP